MSTDFSWHQPVWQRMTQAIQQRRFPHALLLSGVTGVGKKHFARQLADHLLCPGFHQTGVRCHQCHACQLSQANTHPDLVIIEPESSTTIKIDQIREAGNFIQQTALLSGYRVMIIHAAHLMNVNAANALLKTLEEPTSQTVILLVSDYSASLAATLRSRCQKIVLPTPDSETGLAWLKNKFPDATESDLKRALTLAEKAPLAAEQLISTDFFELRSLVYQGLKEIAQRSADPLELASQWEEKEIRVLLDLMLSWVKDLLRLKTISQVDLVNQDFSSDLLFMSQKLSLDALLRYINQVESQYASIRKGHHLNVRLMLEVLLIKWADLCS